MENKDLEFKGTPGEWVAKENYVFPKENASKSICVCHLQDFFHNTRGQRIDDIKPLYNAKLIAAAPDLLEACQEFVRKCDVGEARSTRSYAQMKKAINKALGHEN